MGKQDYQPEQIIAKLREIEILIGNGRDYWILVTDYIPNTHHTYILVLNDMAVKHGHTIIVLNRYQKFHTSPFGDYDNIF